MSEIITNYFEIPHGEDSSFSDLIVKTNYGWVTVLKNGTISDSVAAEYGTIEIMDGGVFNNATVTDGGTIEIRNGGVLSSGLATNGGNLLVEFDPKLSNVPGFIQNVSVGESGYVNVEGSATDLTAMSKGQFDIVKFGKLNKATILDGGFGNVTDGASATDVTVSSGGNFNLIGATAEKTSVYKDGVFSVERNGAVAKETVLIDGGQFVVSSGGTARNTTLNNGGAFQVLDSGTACDLTVAPGGSLSVAAGGKLTGAITFEIGALVSAEDGAILDFDLTQAGVGAKAPLLNDLSFVPDAFHFTLTVDSSLFDGTYKLAGNAAGFDKTISVVNTSGEKLGELTPGDEPVTIDKITYRLSVADNTLSLSLTNENERPTPTIVYVNSEWASLRPNTGVRIGDISAKIGYNAFATGDEAVASIGGDTSVSRELVFLSDGSAASLTGFDSITVDADSLVSLGGTFTGKSITINATGYANYTRKVLVSKGGFTEGTSISVLGDGFNYDYLGDDTLLIISPTVGNTYANADWTEADIENQFSDDGTLLVWETNAFSSFFWAGKKLGNTGTIYLTGGTSSETINLPYAGNNVVIMENTACTVAGYVNGNGGTLTVEGEFIAIGISGFSLLTVKAGGSLTVNGGGITLTEDGIFEFDITDVGAGNEKALVNNLSNVFNSPTYRVRLSDDQARGEYLLATAAAVFTSGILIKGCALTPNGGAVIIGGNSYEITLADDKLFLTIAERPAPGFVYVNTAWAELDNDTEVTVGDDTFCIGYDAFPTGDAAAAAPGDGMVTVLAGGVSFTDPVEKKLTVRDGAAITGRATFTNDVMLEGALVFDTSYADAGNIQISGFSHVSPGKTAKFTLTVSDTQAEGVYRLADEAAGFDKAISVVNTSGTALGTLTVGGDAQEFGGMKYALTLNKNNVLALVVGDVDPNVLTGDLTCAYELTDGMLASSVNIKKGGELYVSKGGVANVTTVDPGGILFVFEGGTATQVREDGGCVDVREGATVEFVPNTFGGSTFSDYGWHTVHSGTVASDLTIENDACLEVYGGGIVRNTTLNYGGEATIIADGVANGITVRDGGDLGVGTDGKLTGKMTFETGAIFYVETGAIIDFDLTQTSPDAETALVNDLSFVLGEPFSYTLTVDDVQENGEFKLAECAAGFDQTVTVMNTSGETLGTLTVGEGAKMLDDGGEYTLTLSEEGFLGVTISNPNIFTGVVENGTKDIYSPEAAVNVIVNEDGTLLIHDGGIASRTTVNTDGMLNVHYGGIAGRTTVNEHGRINVSAGGVASDTIINGYGQMHVYSDGIASRTTVNTDGELNVSAGGIASQTTVNTNGKLNVSKGGVASDTIIKDLGRMDISGGVASDTIIKGLGRMDVSGGVASDTIIKGLGRMDVSGGVASDTTVNSGGYMFISGGVASDTTVDFEGYMYVSGGVVSDTTVSSGAEVSFYAPEGGGKLTGKMTFEDGAKAVSVETGGTIDFDLRQTTADTDPLLNDFSFVTNNLLSFTLTVDGTQTDGVYSLAGNAKDFGGRTITVVNPSDEARDTLKLGGGTKEIDGVKYKLILDSATLAVVVGDYDSTPPTVTGVKADITAPTNQNVTVTADFADETELKSSQYRLDNGDWEAYPEGGVTVDKNVTVTFKAVDAAGNESAEVSYNVTNIDKTPPANPTASADVTAPTNGDVTVTAVFSEDSAKKEYSLDGTTWKTYTGPILFTENGTAYFRGTDAAGNPSGEVSCAVTNIDKTPPANPTASADVTVPTDDKVTVSAKFSDDSAKKEYSLDGTTWKAYTGPITFEENGAAYFRGTDAAGNPSGITKYEVANIQKGPKEPDNDELVYKDKSANTTVTESYGTHLSAPGDEIRLDRIGAVEEPIEINGVEYTFHNHVEKKVDEKIDTIDYAKIVLAHGAKLSFHAEATAAATFTVYSLSEKKGKYSLKKLQTLKLTDKDGDGLFTADSKKLLQLQVSGAYYVSMQFTDRKAADAYYNVMLNGAGSTLPSEFEPYSLGDNTDDWTDMKTAGWDGAVASLGTVTDSGNLITNEWIGFGDKVDYKIFTLADAAQLDFSFNTPGGFVKFTVCKLKETEKRDGSKTYSQITVKTVTATAKKPVVTINDLRLEAGDYFIKVESTNIKKCTGYDVQVTKSTFYADGDGGWNNALLNKKALDKNAQYFYDNKLSLESGSIHFDKAGDYETSDVATEYMFEGKQYGGFVGFGDELDFAKLSVTKTVDVTFSLLATNDATLEVIQVTKKDEDKYTKKSLQTIKYKQGNEDPAVSKNAVTLEVKDGISYYVSVKATNTRNVKVDPNTYYNVTYTIDTHEAAALSMPETSDAFAMSDVLSFGDYAADTFAATSADIAAQEIFEGRSMGLLA